MVVVRTHSIAVVYHILAHMIVWTLMCHATAQLDYKRANERRKVKKGMTDGNVEGCFDQFDALNEPFIPSHILGIKNNRRCQALCTAKGYALAATRSNPFKCLCGNDYPSAFHQVRQ